MTLHVLQFHCTIIYSHVNLTYPGSNVSNSSTQHLLDVQAVAKR